MTVRLPADPVPSDASAARRRPALLSSRLVLGVFLVLLLVVPAILSPYYVTLLN